MFDACVCMLSLWFYAVACFVFGVKTFSDPKLLNRIIHISCFGTGPGPEGHEGLARDCVT